MEKWATELLEALEAASVEAENFILEVADETIGEAIEISVEFVDDLCELLGEALPLEEIDRAFSELLDLDFDLEEGDRPYNRSRSDIFDELGVYITPSATVHPACRGCRNYYGYAHNGNLLVCGMHPYGWDDGNCPDWEGDR